MRQAESDHTLPLRGPLEPAFQELIRGLEWSVRGDQKRVDDGPRRKRHTTYELRSVIIPRGPRASSGASPRPYSVRMSLRDHRAMANALLELLGMDAESAEPAVETKSRAPVIESRVR